MRNLSFLPTICLNHREAGPAQPSLGTEGGGATPGAAARQGPGIRAGTALAASPHLELLPTPYPGSPLTTGLQHTASLGARALDNMPDAHAVNTYSGGHPDCQASTVLVHRTQFLDNLTWPTYALYSPPRPTPPPLQFTGHIGRIWIFTINLPSTLKPLKPLQTP